MSVDRPWKARFPGKVTAHRLLISVSKPMLIAMKLEAERQGVSTSELVRNALAEVLSADRAELRSLRVRRRAR